MPRSQAELAFDPRSLAPRLQTAAFLPGSHPPQAGDAKAEGNRSEGHGEEKGIAWVPEKVHTVNNSTSVNKQSPTNVPKGPHGNNSEYLGPQRG